MEPDEPPARNSYVRISVLTGGRATHGIAPPRPDRATPAAGPTRITTVHRRHQSAPTSSLSTGRLTDPEPSTASWNALMSNAAPSRSRAAARCARISSWPTL